MSYHCAVCHKVSITAPDLARHIMGRGDKPHRDWLASKGLKYSELLIAQMKTFGGEGYHSLTKVLQNETWVDDEIPPAKSSVGTDSEK
ncbi:MAG: hypothetical protein U1D67_03415 [Dehalococcoidia bacterium]|nr:hypothetical protein [Dehalococcoidia bacterium]MDZ4246150.1 hypothetical protein [Dehalococcoidia bacterium]